RGGGGLAVRQRGELLLDQPVERRGDRAVRLRVAAEEEEVRLPLVLAVGVRAAPLLDEARELVQVPLAGALRELGDVLGEPWRREGAPRARARAPPARRSPPRSPPRQPSARAPRARPPSHPAAAAPPAGRRSCPPPGARAGRRPVRTRRDHIRGSSGAGGSR